MTRAPWPLVILILALGSSTINAWYYGSLIVNDRAHESESVNPSNNPLVKPGLIDWSLSPGQQMWISRERRDWRMMVSIELAIVTLAGVAYVLVRSSRNVGRP
jgi:hypothetical protein